jgi:hypothetical protein
MSARVFIVVGIVLPFVAIGAGLLVPSSTLSSVLIPATFVVSGALIGRWWAFVPSLATVIALGLAELATPTSRTGTAIEIHASGFHLGFLLLISSIATALAVAGAAVHVAVSIVLRRLGLAALRNRADS